MNANWPSSEEFVFNGISLIPISAGSLIVYRDNKHLEPQENAVLQLKTEVYVGKYPITHQQYSELAGERLWIVGGPSKPAVDVSYFSAMEFCELLNHEAKKQGQPFFFRLPSEIEWEYICRAGSTALYPFGDKPDDIHLHACFAGNSGYVEPEPFDKETLNVLPYHSGGCTEVGQYLANAFGIYDMCGNIWEWCEPHPGKTETPIDGVDSNLKVLKGGSWTDGAEKLTCEFRRLEDPEVARSNIGFRIVMVKTPAATALSSEADDPLTVTLPEGSISNSIGMNLIRIAEYNHALPKGGKEGADGRENNTNLLFGQTPVTVEQFRLVMGDFPCFYSAGRNPVQVSWNDADEFCRKLTNLPAEISAERRYRLPTEVEWEYASRAGNTATSAEQLRDYDIESRAWTRENTRNKLPLVGLKTPNGFGLHDMLGLVAEWCDTEFIEEMDERTQKKRELSDAFSPNEEGLVAELYNPNEPLKLACGGSWLLDRSQAYFWSRLVLPISHSSIHVGFRVVLEQH